MAAWIARGCVIGYFVNRQFSTHAGRPRNPALPDAGSTLLLERDGYRDLIQRIAVVDCSEARQIDRTMHRSAISEAAVRAIMAAQLSREQRLSKADDVLHNDTDENDLKRQVTTLHARYLALADAHRDRDNSPGKNIDS